MGVPVPRSSPEMPAPTGRERPEGTAVLDPQMVATLGVVAPPVRSAIGGANGSACPLVAAPRPAAISCLRREVVDPSATTYSRTRGWTKGEPVSRILVFTSGAKDWRALLADPAKQWRSGYSACTLAHSWEAADGFPPEVAAPLNQSADPLLTGLTPFLAVPEFKVPLPGGGRDSQNDIFVLAHSSAGPVSIMVEGKVSESFGPTLGEWRRDASPGKDERLRFLLRTLGLNAHPVDAIRYQLLHRAASAVITGEQYRAIAAIILIHSFSEERVGWPDYQAFTRLFGVEATLGSVQRLSGASAVPLFGLWVIGDCSFLQS